MSCFYLSDRGRKSQKRGDMGGRFSSQWDISVDDTLPSSLQFLPTLHVLSLMTKFGFPMIYNLDIPIFIASHPPYGCSLKGHVFRILNMIFNLILIYNYGVRF